MQSASTSIAYCGLHSHPRGETWQGPPHRGQEMNSAHHVPRRSSEGQLHGTRDIQVTWERRACVSAQRMGRCYLMLPLRESCSPGAQSGKQPWLQRGLGVLLYTAQTHMRLQKWRRCLLASSERPSCPPAPQLQLLQQPWSPQYSTARTNCRPLPALGDSSTPIWRENFCPVL